MKFFKYYLILLFVLIISCASKEVVKENITVRFTSLANDFAAVEMSLYDNNKFEIKTATLEMHGNDEYITKLEGVWTETDSTYILKTKNLKKQELIEYFFGNQEYGKSGFDIISDNKVSFPVDKEFLIINNVMCQKQ